ncbi:MAG: LacI family transcriptional regulator [Chloroflexi bacterium]|nr:MAG: LacI family transcriptional regulator [Chloroflexota bacterium]
MNRKVLVATIRDVALEAKVSAATVSRFLNHTATVSPPVADRIQAAVALLKYVPNGAARTLTTRRTNLISLVVPHRAFHYFGSFFAPLLSGVETVATEYGMSLVISARRESFTDPFSLALGPRNSDGMLVFANSLPDEVVIHMHSMGFPMVLIHRSPPPGLDTPCVLIENERPAFEIVQHLVQVHGRRRILFLRGIETQQDSLERERGYLRALQANGIEFDPALVLRGDFDREVALTVTKRALADGLQFDAAFACDDEAALGVKVALEASGLRVPADVALVGFDDQYGVADLTPPLTTVRAPSKQVGQVAAEQLVRCIAGEIVERVTRLPVSVVLRQSCGCTAAT